MSRAGRLAVWIGFLTLSTSALRANIGQVFTAPLCVKPGESFTLEQKATSDGGRLNAHLRLCFPPGVAASCHDDTMTASPGAPTGGTCHLVGGCQYKENGAFDGLGPQCDAFGAWPEGTNLTLKVTCDAPAVIPADSLVHFGGQAFDISSGFGTAFDDIKVDANCIGESSITKKIRLWTANGPGPPVDSATVQKGSFMCYDIAAELVRSDLLFDSLPLNFVPVAVKGQDCDVSSGSGGGYSLLCHAKVGKNTVRICGYFKATGPASNSAELYDDNPKIKSNTTLATVAPPTSVTPAPNVAGENDCFAGLACYFAASLGAGGNSRTAAASAGFAWLSSDSQLVPLGNGPSLRRSFAAPGTYKLTALATQSGFTSYKDLTVKVKAGAAGCSASANTLCLGKNGRFKVQVDWQDLPGKTSNVAQAHPLTNDTGAFWFFSPDNLELLVKVLDGTALNNKFWVFYGALSNVQYQIKVTDTRTGVVKTYTNPQSTQASGSDTAAFAAAQEDLDAVAQSAAERQPEEAPSALAEPATSCATGGATLCLDGRFRVRVNWTNAANGTSGVGTAGQLTAQSGDFWFFNSSNLELLVKIIDARALNGKFWFFYGALSDVAYTITVTDTGSGAVKTYNNPQGTQASKGDTSAF